MVGKEIAYQLLLFLLPPFQLPKQFHKTFYNIKTFLDLLCENLLRSKFDTISLRLDVFSLEWIICWNSNVVTQKHFPSICMYTGQFSKYSWVGTKKKWISSVYTANVAVCKRSYTLKEFVYRFVVFVVAIKNKWLTIIYTKRFVYLCLLETKVVSCENWEEDKV